MENDGFQGGYFRTDGIGRNWLPASARNSFSFCCCDGMRNSSSQESLIQANNIKRIRWRFPQNPAKNPWKRANGEGGRQAEGGRRREKGSATCAPRHRPRESSIWIGSFFFPGIASRTEFRESSLYRGPRIRVTRGVAGWALGGGGWNHRASLKDTPSIATRTEASLKHRQSAGDE